MAVHAHPDDESSKGAATMARYAAEGVQVLVVSCTGGERGDVLNPRLENDPEVLRDLPGLRRREMAEAAAALGVSQRWLGFVDSGLPQGDPLPPLPEGSFAVEPLEVATEALVRVVREFRPQVMTTYNENGGYPHPDHMMTHKISAAAFDAAADPQAFPDAGPTWQISKMYYDHGFSQQRIMTIHEAMVEAGLDSPYADWLERRRGMEDRSAKVTTRIECAQYFANRDQALLAHATQIDPDGFFFAVPRDIERRVWPYEEYELARSLVDSEVPEDDLFAGLRK
ncbi:MAG TPA: mycothiol conjugate amidase Mca [Ruania sp.]|nr:mycothiol conjugate amidase Mca [Ruania sp.]